MAKRVTLSFALIVKDAEAYLPRLLAGAQLFADEIVIGVDCSSSDSTEEICRRYADKVFLISPVVVMENALGWLHNQCTGDWILRLDADELPSEGLVRALSSMLEDREVTHYVIPRRWVTGPNRQLWIDESPWWPDHQIRLYRNILSIVDLPTAVHQPCCVAGRGRTVVGGSIYHYDLVYHSEARRRAKVRLYEQLLPGGSLPWFYLTPEGLLNQDALPEHDLPFLVDDSPAPRPGGIGAVDVAAWPSHLPLHSAIQRSGPRGDSFISGRSNLGRSARNELQLPGVVSSIETQRGGARVVSECGSGIVETPAISGRHKSRSHSVDAHLFGAKVTFLNKLRAIRSGGSAAVEVTVRNLSTRTWDGSKVGGLDVRLSYHWFRTSGELCEWDGLRTPMQKIVTPGEEIQLLAHVRAPAEIGKFRFQWDLVIEGVTWFSERGFRGPHHEVQIQRPLPEFETLNL